MITDLPNELMSALSQGLSQFGINLPPMPTSLLTGSGSPVPATFAPGLGTPRPDHTGAGTCPADHPGAQRPGLTTPGLRSGLTTPGLTARARHLARRDADQTGADARTHQPPVRCPTRPATPASSA